MAVADKQVWVLAEPRISDDTNQIWVLGEAWITRNAVTVAVGWTGGDVNGVAVATIGKINGVAIADITKVNGIA